MDRQTIAFYESSADSISSRYESVDSPVKALYPEFIKAGDVVLDIGCGSGRDIAWLHTQGCKVTGIDPSFQMIKNAKATHPQITDSLFQGSLPADLNGISGIPYDIVLLSAVIMHIPDESFVESGIAISRIMKDHGTLIISHCLNRKGLNSQQREANGRLFIIRSSNEIEELLKPSGFMVKQSSIREDSLNRYDLMWETLVCTRIPLHSKLPERG